MNKADGSFDLVLDSVNFGGESSFLFDVELVFIPVAAALKDYNASRQRRKRNMMRK